MFSIFLNLQQRGGGGGDPLDPNLDPPLLLGVCGLKPQTLCMLYAERDVLVLCYAEIDEFLSQTDGQRCLFEQPNIANI